MLHHLGDVTPSVALLLVMAMLAPGCTTVVERVTEPRLSRETDLIVRDELAGRTLIGDELRVHPLRGASIRITATERRQVRLLSDETTIRVDHGIFTPLALTMALSEISCVELDRVIRLEPAATGSSEGNKGSTVAIGAILIGGIVVFVGWLVARGFTGPR